MSMNDGGEKVRKQSDIKTEVLMMTGNLSYWKASDIDRKTDKMLKYEESAVD